MRPIYLKMSAFGPFLHEECVDFDQLSQNGLFLITGQTGSGKTTIFDAITFALYGEASGSNRNVKTLRSDLAKDEKTYVELTFMVRNEVYKITRTPTYSKEGRKTDIPATADLVLHDGKIISGPKEVNKEILKIIGLDVNQFKQIAMIAQGEFTKLLFASSDDKEVIFRRIFNTYKYDQFEKLLYDKAKELEIKVEQSKTQMETYRASIDEPFDGDYDIYLNHLDECIKAKDTVYKEANKKNEDLNKEIQNNKVLLSKEKETNEKVAQKNNLEAQLNSLENQKDIYNAKDKQVKAIDLASTLVSYENEVLSISEHLKNDCNTLKGIESELKEKEEEFNIIKENYNQVAELKDKSKDLLLKKQLLDSKAADQARLEEFKKDKLRYEKDLSTEENTLLEFKQKEQENANKKEETSNKINECRTLAAREEEIKLRKSTISNRINAYKQLQEKQKDYDKACGIHDSLIKDFNTINDELTNQEALHRGHETLFYSMQAGILASTLEEGNPCPVCGSIHHPNLAKLSDTTITSSLLDDEKNTIEQTRKKMEEYSYKASNAKTNKELLKGDITSLITNNELENVTESSLIQSKNLIQKEYDAILEAKGQIVQLQNQDKDIDEEKSNLENKITEVNRKITELKDSLSNVEGQISSIGEIDPDLDNQIKQTNEEYDALEEKIRSYEKQYKEMESFVNGKNGQKQQLSNAINSNSEKYDIKNAQWQEKLSVFSNYEEYDGYKKQIPNVESIRQEIVDYKLNIQGIKGQISAIQLTRDEIVDLTALENSINQDVETYNTKKDEEQKAYTELDNYKRVYTNISSIYKKNGDLVKKFNLYYELFSVTKGDNPQKLSFERYILSAYFEQIILLANIRLKDMTNNRYTLVRKETKSGKQSGLDLQVKDYQSGTVREITTLSGGESFKAALSLALGLSDMIQHVSGGIELNTLFIDEGFGSLDQESLDQAIKVLVSLNDSNKMIGIISHVTELKQRIDNQLNVMKNSKGSYIDMN